MIDTYSKFYLGLEITESNYLMNVNESGTDYEIELDQGFYAPEDLADHIESKLNEALSQPYIVTFNRSARTLTIAPVSGTVSFLCSQGGIYSTIGFGSSDIVSVSTNTGSAFVTEYQTQFKLQDYVDSEHNQSLRQATVSRSASGKVSTVYFGTDKVFEFSVKYITDRPQIGTLIRSNTSGVSNFLALMEYATLKGELEFMPDENDVNTYFKVILESTEASSEGTAFRLIEQYGRGMVGFFESGILRFRVCQ